MYKNSDLDDHIHDCLLEVMAAIQSVDDRPAFVFIVDLNAHHSYWMGSSHTNDHGVAACVFATSSGCSQVVGDPMHVRGGVLDLVMTNVPELLDVQFKAPIGNSDHMSLKVNLTQSQLVPDMCFRKEVFLKGSADWDGVCDDISRLPRGDIVFDQCLVAILNELLLSVVRILRVRTRNKPCFDDNCCRIHQVTQEAYHAWSRHRTAALWDGYTDLRRQSGRIYAAAEAEYNNRSREFLCSDLSPHKCWSTLKSAVFGSRSPLPPLLDTGDTLVCSPEGKANLLNSHFDSKPCRLGIELPSTCHPEGKMSSFAFRSGEVRRLISGLDAYAGTDLACLFSLFYKKAAAVLAPKPSIIFRKLIRSGEFPECWRTANVVPMCKVASSPIVDNYPLI
jgi:hypothetical protein